MIITVACKILLKKEVLDSKGRTLLKLLQKEDSAIKQCFYGKYIKLDIEASSAQQALKKAEKLAQEILHNKLVENFELEVLSCPDPV